MNIGSLIPLFASIFSFLKKKGKGYPLLSGLGIVNGNAHRNAEEYAKIFNLYKI
jgi:hypothetical protein